MGLGKYKMYWDICCTEKYSNNDRVMLKGQKGQPNEGVSLAKVEQSEHQN